MKDKATTVLAILLVLSVGYIGYTEYSEYQDQKYSQYYQQGLIDAQAVINSNIISALNEEGYVSFTAPTDTNETVTIKLGIIQ